MPGKQILLPGQSKLELAKSRIAGFNEYFYVRPLTLRRAGAISTLTSANVRPFRLSFRAARRQELFELSPRICQHEVVKRVLTRSKKDEAMEQELGTVQQTLRVPSEGAV